MRRIAKTGSNPPLSASEAAPNIVGVKD